MPIFILPFREEQSGWYEIEAESLEAAKEIVNETNVMIDHTPYYRSGTVEYDEKEMYEQKDNKSE